MSGSAAVTGGASPDWIEAATARLGDGPLADMRAAALARFRETGLPTTRMEAWKYTNLRKLARRSFRLVEEAPRALPDDTGARLIADLEALTLLFADARCIKRPDLPAGLSVTTRSDATASELVTEKAGHVFEALNAALLHEVIHISVAPDTAGTLPLYLAFIAGAEGGTAAAPRIVVELGENAELDLVEHYTGGQGGHFANAITDIRLAPGARLVHYRLEESAEDAFHIGGVHVSQAKDSHYTSHVVNTGGALARLDIAVDLREPGAEAVLNGLYLAAGRQHLDSHTRVDHRAPATLSREEYRGILTGTSRAVFNGKAIVHPDAQRIEAHQANHNLLLSEGAEVDTKPELEIYADDVKCSHGATVGQLDSNALFYLLSRGLDPEAARELLTFAFADAVLADMAHPAVRRHAERRLVGRLPDSDRLREFL